MLRAEVARVLYNDSDGRKLEQWSSQLFEFGYAKRDFTLSAPSFNLRTDSYRRPSVAAYGAPACD